MANLVKYHLQVTGLDTSSAALLANKSVVSSGITNTGGITSTGSIQTDGSLLMKNSSGDDVSLSIIDDSMGGDDIKVTRI